jgi:hypothetical protein
MALVGEESEEDLHSDPLFRLPFFDTLWCATTLLLLGAFIFTFG